MVPGGHPVVLARRKDWKAQILSQVGGMDHRGSRSPATTCSWNCRFILLPAATFSLFWAGTALGQWTVSQAEWIVSANECSARCFAYTVEGRSRPVVGRVIAANATRIAVVVGPHRAEVVELDKITTSEQFQGKPITILRRAPWKIRIGWKLLDIFNGNW